ncbi:MULTISPECIES: chemotaxis protein CheW [unclassified Leptolyngbya]|uniref:chemotaxis protein CheW n=1 Tax=unclassified Leptolyngbya TaxID=2650499 RepID=UPI0016831134|nr:MULTISPECIES: chemotaxis protein CheW [unclassified Leptolyngbya]MBD1911104.1 purine-binding chemotaxis protein CheW [Leptolyngbya sp. FACHB-8]MBD2157086.1 purine-binding chemotaxis protein CheW [Leptolyngbya sp. FACHB-16]
MNAEYCWSEIGIEGDRSCDRLESVGHCINCPVYHEAGRGLLNREIPLDYLQEWTEILAQPPEAQMGTLSTAVKQDSLKIGQGTTLSAMVFRLGSERFALPVSILQEITRPVPIHTLPHRSDDLFLGLVNIRGEILPCASLSQFIGVEMPIDPTYSRINLRRMMVIGQQESRWVFPVDEVHRVYRFHPDELQKPPVVIAKAHQSYTRGIIDWQDKKVNYLDADHLLNTLDRRLL